MGRKPERGGKMAQSLLNTKENKNKSREHLLTHSMEGEGRATDYLPIFLLLIALSFIVAQLEKAGKSIL